MRQRPPAACTLLSLLRPELNLGGRTSLLAYGIGASMPASPRPVFRLERQELEAVLATVGAFDDLHLTIDGCDPSTTAAAFRAVFDLPCMENVDRIKLLALIKRWALEAYGTPSFAPLEPGQPARELTAAACRRILAAAFVGNVCDVMEGSKRNRGGLNFARHIQSAAREPGGVGAQKTAALLTYFAAGASVEGSADDQRRVTFERLACPDAAEFQRMLTSSKARLGGAGLPGQAHGEAAGQAHGEAAGQAGGGEVGGQDGGSWVVLHSGTMEAAAGVQAGVQAGGQAGVQAGVVADATGFVNFANADFGFGCFIPSCTQEEILQVCCPEFNVGMLFIGRMGDEEVVNVRNCRRFSIYSGYLGTYRCLGPIRGPRIVHDILTLDACMSHHFRAG